MFKLMYRNVMSIDTLNSPLFPSSTSVYLYRNVVCAGVGVLLLLPGRIFFFESGGHGHRLVWCQKIKKSDSSGTTKWP